MLYWIQEADINAHLRQGPERVKINIGWYFRFLNSFRLHGQKCVQGLFFRFQCFLVLKVVALLSVLVVGQDVEQVVADEGGVVLAPREV